jgi:cytochrome c oxidase subunit 2
MSMMKLKKVLTPVAASVRSGSRILLALVSSISLPVLASYDVNIPPPATPISNQIFGLHLYILGFCAVIFVLVFSVMFYSIFKFRK